MAAAAGLVARRARSHRLILSAAFATILLATTLLSAVAIYTGSVADNALHAAVLAAPATQTGAEVTGSLHPDRVIEQDRAVREAVAEAYPGMPVRVSASALSGSYGLPPRLGAGEDTLTVFGFYDDLPAHARLTSGRWPAPASEQSPAAPGRPPVPAVEAVLPQPAATALGLAAGDRLRVKNRLSGVAVDVHIVGSYVPRDPGAVFWFGRGLETSGRSGSTSFTTLGPLVTAREAFLTRLPEGGASGGRWRVAPALDELAAEEIDGVAAGVRGLSARLAEQRLFSDNVGDTTSVSTELPALLDQVSRALVVARSTILIPVAQLVLLAGYALLLTARLLSEHRHVETALLRARGASSRQLMGLSLREGMLLALPAALLGPPLAALALQAVDRAGPLATAGIRLDASPAATTWLVAGAAAVGCALALVLPGVNAAGSYVESQQARGRPSRRGLLQRAGADLLLLAVAALAYWQLRRYRSPVLADAGGRLGADPLLVVGPALALLALAVFTLRLLPVLARLTERVSGRTTFTPALGTWQVSRRPARYAGPALLLVMALAIGTLSAAYSASWRRSQGDQAAFRVGADLRVTAPPGVRDTAGLGSRYADLPGVRTALPLARERVQLAGEPAELLALDSARAAGVFAVRPDLADGGSPRELLAGLHADRPQLPAVKLPGRPSRLEVVASLRSGRPGGSRLPRELVAGGVRQAEVEVAVRDGTGVIRRLGAGTLRADGRRHRLGVALLPAEGQPAWPLEVVGLEFSYRAPFVQRSLTLAVDELRTVGPGGVGATVPRSGASWEVGVLDDADLGMATPKVRSVDRPSGGLFVATVASGAGDPLDRDVRLGALPGALPGASPGASTGASRDASSEQAAALPALVSERALDVSSAGRGDVIAVEVAGDPVQVRVAGVLAELPTVGPDKGAVLVDLPSLAGILYQRGDLLTPDDFLLDAAGDTGPAAAALRADPGSAGTVLDRVALGRELRDDPLAAGVLGALLMSFAAAAAFAAVGFAVNAVVSARERVAEFAVLRALGVSPRQLIGVIGVEQAYLVVLGLLVGLVLGAAVATLVVPLVLLTAEAARVVPPVLVSVPWVTVLGLVAALVAVLAAIVLVLARYLRGTALGGTLRAGEDA